MKQSLTGRWSGACCLVVPEWKMLRRTYLCVFAKENKKINYAAYVQLCLKACLGCASAQSTGSRVYIYCSTQYAVRARCPRGGDTRKCGPGTDSMPCVTEAWSGTGLVMEQMKKFLFKNSVWSGVTGWSSQCTIDAKHPFTYSIHPKLEHVLTFLNT